MNTSTVHTGKQMWYMSLHYLTGYHKSETCISTLAITLCPLPRQYSSCKYGSLKMYTQCKQDRDIDFIEFKQGEVFIVPRATIRVYKHGVFG